MDVRLAKAVIATLAVLLAVVTLQPVRAETIVQARTVPLPFKTRTVQVATMPAGFEVVQQRGATGTAEDLTYVREWVVLGERFGRHVVPAGDRPAFRIVSAPVDRVIGRGAVTSATVAVTGADEPGDVIGTLGADGRMHILATGFVHFWKGGGSGPAGDPAYAYSYPPLRLDAPVGSLLLRVGTGTPTTYESLPLGSDGYRVLRGKPGDTVVGMVNDHLGLYEDNLGAFTLKIHY
jgi:hypothetical protein